MRIDWPYCVRSSKNRHKEEEGFHDFKKLDVIVSDHDSEHQLFKHFLNSMLVIDPKKRPSASELLEHAFLKKD